MTKTSLFAKYFIFVQRSSLLALATLGLVILPIGLATAQEIPAEKTPSAPLINNILGHLKVLGDDTMEGRGAGTPGGELAADYIESQLKEIGLPPVLDGYRQPVPMHGSLPLSQSRLTLLDVPGQEKEMELALWDDYVLFRTGAQTFLPEPTPLVFVAYGIVAPEYDYNDYLRTDVAGRIVVILEGEPPSNDDAYFEGLKPTVHSDPEMKFRTALSRGARGAILIPSPREASFLDWRQILSAFQTEDVTLPYRITGNLNVLLHFEKAPLLFANAPVSFIEMLGQDADGSLAGFPLNIRARFTGAFKERDFAADNVMAWLPGNDPLLRESYILVSAHYDHLGIGRPVNGDAIYNGVVDNASGTAVTLELARVLAQQKEKNKRSFIFLFVTGEEKGLLGSRYYCDHPAVPLSKTIAAVNIDGISIIDTTSLFVGVGADLSTLGSHLDETLQGMNLYLGKIPAIFQIQEPFHHSDQLAFAQAGIPSILVMEGFGFRNVPVNDGIRRFIEWSKERYHTPFDDLGQPLNSAAMEQHATVLLAFLRRLGDTAVEPQWLPGAPFVGARLRSMAEKR